MKLSLALLAATAAAVSGKRVTKKAPKAGLSTAETDFADVKVKADSKTGHKLLSKARRLGGSRKLEGGDEMTWVAGFSIKFHSCQATQDYYGGQFADYNNNADQNYYYYGGEQQQNQNQQGEEYNYYAENGQENANAYGADNYYDQYGQGYYNNENRDNFEGMYNQNLVHFMLCPSDSCWRCKGGAHYVVTLSDFVDAMLEAKMTATQYQCEHVREHCWCENANNEYQCLATCFKNAGVDASSCEGQGQNNENEFDIQEALECKQLDVDKEAAEQYYYNTMFRKMNNGQEYYGQQGQNFEVGEVYVGPYCAKNGHAIHLGLFMEETCSYPAPKGMYEALNYGSSLPYSKKSIISTSECISCKEPKEVDYQNYWDQQDADEVTDVCENLYEIAGKCEEGLDGYHPYRDNSGCGFINNMKAGGLSIPSATNIPAKVFAGIFAVTTGLLAMVSLVLYKKNQRQNVSLAGDAVIS